MPSELHPYATHNPVLQIGLLADRPEPTRRGRLYYATDIPALYYSDGENPWGLVADAGGGGGGAVATDSSELDFSGAGTAGSPLTASVKNGSIAAARLSFDAATQAELDAHINDSDGAHAASAVSFSPTGTIAATTVQAAIAEVATEAGGAGLYQFFDMRSEFPNIKGDAVTDDATAINAALQSLFDNYVLNNPGFVGVTAYFGPGVYVVGAHIECHGGINIVGAGTAQTIFKKKAGSTNDVIRSFDWAAGNVRTGGVLLQDFTVNGNYGEAGTDAVGSVATGSGILWNGTAWINRVVVRNCREYGMFLYQNSADGAAFPSENPGSNYYKVQNFVVWNCYGISHVHVAGGTDNQLSEFWIYHRDNTNPPNNVGLLLTSGGNKVIQGHFWSIEAILTNVQVQSTSTNNVFTNCVIESPKAGGQSILLNGPSQIRGCHLYCNPAGAKKGIVLASTAGGSIIENNKLDNFETGGVDFGAGGPAWVRVVNNQVVCLAAGSAFIGTIPTDCVFEGNSTHINGVNGGDAANKGRLFRRPDGAWRFLQVNNSDAVVVATTTAPNFQ